MRKIIYVLLIVTAVLGLSACGKNTADDLQSKKWNVVSTNGESFTAEFSKNKFTIKLGSLSKGFTYKINKDEISLEEDGEKPLVFEIEQDGDEYNFKATTKAIKDEYGDLTLSPSKE
ncbi:hypothetical protein HOO54_05045 [Bacillus sp. WMMC1349]|uniref:hypothetical protein n=1 Tax=Bacillus sp. WMMC1349 TaxID=2736254 RepID=UPI001555D3EC|nr:hypothetical protein [Bacillus sp. WMMC1349]NPC90762.1 hypothetical protein [Bacillus sp. WMMC1349]NPC91624.1 hypothetical protein [Bacillus sp. WMMC1349]